MQTVNIWEPLAVRCQTLKTAIESACMLLRIDDVVSGKTNFKINQIKSN
jgi:T-complex protein 1 subunit gamma